MERREPSQPSLFRAFLATPDADAFRDFTLVCGGRRFPVSRVTLVAASKFFYGIFDCDDEEEDSRELTLDRVTPTGLDTVLRHIYNRPLGLAMDIVWEVVQAADFLLVDAVTQACTEYICQHIQPWNALGVEEQAGVFRLAEVEERCGEVLRELGEAVVVLPLHRLLALLRDDRLPAAELEVWRAAMAWLRAEEWRWGVRERVLSAVRFGLMDLATFEAEAEQQGVGEVAVVAEAREYLTTMASPTEEAAARLRATYAETPELALPRLPSSYLLVTVGDFESTRLMVYDMLANRWTQVGWNCCYLNLLIELFLSVLASILVLTLLCRWRRPCLLASSPSTRSAATSTCSATGPPT